MSSKLIYRVLPVIVAFGFFVLTVSGQEPTKQIPRSSEKVIISGKIYYIHIVKKGQTLYSLSKAYHVPEKEISKENPILVTGLQEGMILKIPYVPETENENKIYNRDTGRYIYHLFKKGETLYSLGQKYNVKVEDILKANPGIEPDNISIGMEIKIPGRRVVPEHLDFSSQTGKYRLHTVASGETLYSIARQYHVTVEDIRLVNNLLHESIQPGQELRIPRVRISPEQMTEPLNDTLINAGYRENPIPCDTFPMLGKEVTWKVALMLPLFLDQNSKRSYIDSSRINPSTGKKIKKVIYRAPNWIFPPTLNFLSFYEGAMIGLDTLGKKGIRAEITVFDTQRDMRMIDSLIHSGVLDSMNLIIGPVYPASLSLVAEYAKNRHIPVVSPLSRKEDFLYFNPYAFQCRPSKKTEWLQVVKYLAGNLDKNIVIIHAEDTMKQKEYNWVKDQLMEAISHFAHPEIIGVKEVVVPSVIAPTDTMNNIRLSLDKYRENLVWVFSDKEGFVSEVTSRLHTIRNKYPIQLVGSSAWRYFDNVDLNYLFSMNLHLFTPYFVKEEDQKEKTFIKKFRLKYFTEPSELSIAWDGYDIVTYFLSALYRYGHSFPDCISSFHAPICIDEYHFVRTGWFSGLMNQDFHLIQYKQDYTISEIPFPEPDTLR